MANECEKCGDVEWDSCGETACPPRMRYEIESRMQAIGDAYSFMTPEEALPGFRTAVAEIHGVPEDRVEVAADGAHLTARVRPDVIEINITAVPL